ncbi:MAG: SBBP repeat-containing protein [Verrucomicrobiae bacterium]|nr:SBBP repeat-containing protein [Verrucomicrobiae bacterium]
MSTSSMLFSIFRIIVGLTLASLWTSASLAQTAFLKTLTDSPSELGVQIVDQAVAPDGALYVIGQYHPFSGAAIAEGMSIPADPAGGLQQTFLAKQSSSGAWEWVKILQPGGGANSKCFLRCIAISDDFIAVGGHYFRPPSSSEIVWDPFGSNQTIPLPAITNNLSFAGHGFVLKLDLQGEYLSSNHIEGRYATNRPDNDVEWDNDTHNDHADLTGSTKSRISTIAIGSNGKISVGGSYASTGNSQVIWFHDAPKLKWLQRLYGNENDYAFVASAGADLTWNWASSWGVAGISPDHGNTVAKVAIDSAGFTYAAGQITGGTADADQKLAFMYLWRAIDGSTSGADTFIYETSDDDNTREVSQASFLVARITADGYISRFMFDQDEGSENAESYASDLVLTSNGGYVSGSMRGSGLDNRIQGVALTPPGNNGIDTNSAATFPFFFRFDLEPTGQINVPVMATIAGASVQSSATSIASDGFGNIYVAGVADGNLPGLYRSTGASTVHNRDISILEPGGRPFPYVIKLTSDLTYVGVTVPTDLFNVEVPIIPTVSRSDADYGRIARRGYLPPKIRYDKRANRIYWTGLFQDGSLTLGTANRQSSTPVVGHGDYSSFLTALDVSSNAAVQLAEQVRLTVNSEFGTGLVDRRWPGGDPSAIPADTYQGSFVEPAGATETVDVFRGERIMIRVPNRILTSVERDVSGAPIPNGARLLHEALFDPDKPERSLNDYLTSGLWPNYPRTRYTCVGFDIEDSVVSGSSNEYILDIEQDTVVNFNWRVEHALDVVSKIEQESDPDPGVNGDEEILLQDEELRTLGNMQFSAGPISEADLITGVAREFQDENGSEYQWGRNWILEDGEVTVDIGNEGLQLPEDATGERFIVQKYAGSGSALSSDPGFDPARELTLDAFSIAEPSELVLTWRKQIKVSLGPILNDDARPFPFIHVSGDPSQNFETPFDGLGELDVASRWFDYGANIFVGAPKQPGEGIALQGWQTGSGHVLRSQGTLSSPLLSEQEGNSDNVGFLIESLEIPTFVTWNYGTIVFKLDVPIGEALDPELLNLSASAEAGDPERIVDYSGTHINKSNLPEDIQTDLEPRVTIVSFVPPGTSGANAVLWDAVSRKLFPLRPGKYLVEFKAGDADRTPVFVEMASGFFGDEIPQSSNESGDMALDSNDPGYEERRVEKDAAHLGTGTKQIYRIIVDTANAEQELGVVARLVPKLGDGWPQAYKYAHYRHIAGASGVTLDNSLTDDFYFENLNYFEAAPGEVPESDLPREIPGAGRIEGGQFFSDLAGRSVLVFRQSNPVDPASFPSTGDSAKELAMVRVVETRVTEEAITWEEPNWSTSFDGKEDYVSIANLEDVLAGKNSMTVEAWVKPDTSMAKDGYIFSINTSSGGNRALFGYGDDAFSVFTSGSELKTAAPHGSAYHAVWVIDNGNWRFYLNGQQMGTHTESLNVDQEDQIHIGMELDTQKSSNFWDGAIDELSVYDRALTPEQVAAHASANSAEYPDRVLADSPVAYWRFAEVTNSVTAFDELEMFHGAYKGSPTGRRAGIIPDPVLRETAEIGSPLASAFDTAGLGTGWLATDGDGQLHNPDIYDRLNITGPIIPVNRRLTPWKLTDGYENELLVVWYENLTNSTDAGPPADEPSINWPYQPVHYPSDQIAPPSNPGLIVMASRAGTAGLLEDGTQQLIYDPARFSNVRVYNQPDRSAKGYNPNEEHALIADGLYEHRLDENQETTFDALELSGKEVKAPAAFALRTDLNVTTGAPQDFTSDPLVLVEYFDAETGLSGMQPYEIKFELPAKYEFEYPIEVGEPVLALYPLNHVIGIANYLDSDQTDNSTAIDGTYYLNGTPNQVVYWIDTVGTTWIISGPTDSQSNPHLLSGFYYPLQPGFWNDSADIGDKQQWLPNVTTTNGAPPVAERPGMVRYNTRWPDELPILKIGETLMYPGGEYRKADNPEAPGLPGVIGWAAGEILFDSRNPSMQASMTDSSNVTARLVRPLSKVTVDFDPSENTDLQGKIQPASDHIDVDGLEWRFNKLSASLQRRVFYDPQLKKLGIKGVVSGRTAGDTDLTASPDPVFVLEPNILSPSEKAELLSLGDSDKMDFGSGTPWDNAIDVLYKLSRDPKNVLNDGSQGDDDFLAGLVDTTPVDPDDLETAEGALYLDPNNRKHGALFGPGLALVPNQGLLEEDPASFEGYVTLVENAHPANPDLSPVTIHVVKLEGDKRYRGAIKTVLSPNVFDEKVVIKHTGDFGVNIDELTYEWYYRPADGKSAPLPADDPTNPWKKLPGETRNEVVLQGSPTLLLGDNLFFARYKHTSEAVFGADINDPFPWEWAGAGNSPQIQADGTSVFLPQLVLGWVKRVLDAVNPYEARFSDFRNNESPATYASMIQQAGGPFVGPVALNPDKNVIENVGLIELYQTVLNRAKDLSIDLTSPVGNESIYQALLLAATRISDLYMLLGNEAYVDAQDPTIGIGTSSIAYGELAPTVWSFQNQEASLLHEELALLRGTDYGKGFPVENRLFWNFVKGQGEAAYATNYIIKDVNLDGFINESDAKIQFPQGHGDGWGHFLSAQKSQYDLLQHPFFEWEARKELYNLLDIVIEVDFLDETKFVRTAAAKAKAGAEIVDLTYRERYIEDPDGQWQGYTDSDPARAWGVSGWATRAGQGALFDFYVGNALVPFDADDPDSAAGSGDAENLDNIDRGSIRELAELAAMHKKIQATIDEAGDGNNPLGLDQDAVVFDINPVNLDRQFSTPTTHYQQIAGRAGKAAANAIAAFDYANSLDRRLRQVEQLTDKLRIQADEQDRSFRNRLIQVYGTPYEGLIGPGGAYPEGYEGPDFLFPQYIDNNSPDDYNPDSASTYFDVFDAPTDDAYQIDAFQRFAFLVYGVPRNKGDGSYQLSEFFDEFTELSFGDTPEDSTNESGDDFYERFSNSEDINLLQDDDTVITLPFPNLATTNYGFRANENWGQRRSYGEIQQKLLQIVQAQLALNKSLDDYQSYVRDLHITVHGLQADRQGFAKELQVEHRAMLINSTIRVLETGVAIYSDVINGTREVAQATISAASEGIPLNVGFTNSTGSPAKGVVESAQIPLLTGLDTSVKVAKAAQLIGNAVSETATEVGAINAMAREYEGSVRSELLELVSDLNNDSTFRFAIAENLRQLDSRVQEFDTITSKGERLVQERTAANQRLASTVQENRYHDMTIRLERNQALQKYRESFDLLAKYVYLSAKAYDYETSLDTSHPASASGLIGDITRARTLGHWSGGKPQLGGGGLAEILAKLNENYDVLNGQLGFNNPQKETGRLSLRHELFRVRDGEKSDERWFKVLENHRVPDLWRITEFRRYCRPFAAEEAGAQPGLVIPFSTEINEGNNVFGWPLGGMDHAYDPSQFATKVRAVGAWFENYAETQLSQTPRIYLVPAGIDVMRIPDSPTLATRTWNVIDQKIPVPFQINDGNLNDPDWMAARDSVDGSFSEIRRFSRFRAYHDHGGEDFDEGELTWDSRLAGRSIWNTKWVLIIPGSTLHANADYGLDTFIGSASGDFGVSDIKLMLNTYSHSGN